MERKIFISMPHDTVYMTFNHAVSLIVMKIILKKTTIDNAVHKVNTLLLVLFPKNIFSPVNLLSQSGGPDPILDLEAINRGFRAIISRKKEGNKLPILFLEKRALYIEIRVQ
jgi:hypothetical protein